MGKNFGPAKFPGFSFRRRSIKTVLASLSAVVLILSGCDLYSRGDFFDEVEEVLYGNSPPVAVTGTDFGVTTGSTANLDGSGSHDPDGDPFTFAWTFISVPVGSALTDASIAGQFSPTASFVPDVDGTYNLELRLDDGEFIGTDTIVVVASTVNTPPLADAGIDQNVHTGTTVNLDGSASSDSDLDPLSFLWTFDTVPGGSGLTDVDIAGITSPTPSFVPDVAGSFILRLTVDDGTDSDFDIVTINVNTPPLADAGIDQILGTGILVNLDGSGSSDPDLDPLSYLWNFDAVPGGSTLTDGDILNSTTAAPSFTTDVGGSYVLRLVVDDGTDNASDTVSVNANTAPVADAGTDLNVTTGNPAVLDGSGSSDPDLDPLIFTWNFNTVPGGSLLTDVDIVAANTDTPSFIPDVDGLYVLRLVVDDSLDVDSDTVNVNAATNTPPVADAGADQNGLGGTPVHLNGTASFDPNPSDTITYLWEFMSTPGGSALINANIQDVNTSTPYFVPDLPGTYQLRLTVDDGSANNSDLVDVNVGTVGPELVGEWLFSGGSLLDTSLYGTIAVPTNAVPTPDRDGNPDAAYYFNNNAQIVLGNDPQLNHTDMTSFSCWFRPDELDTGYGRIVSKRNSPAPEGWELTIGTGDKVSMNRSGTLAAENIGPGMVQGVWYHLAFTWDPTGPPDQAIFYLNGNPLPGTALYGGASNEPVMSAVPLTLGSAAYSLSNQFMGAIDDVRLYHGILTPAQIADLAAEPAVP